MTMEQPGPDRTPGRPRLGRRSRLAAFVAVLALAAGAVVGTAAFVIAGPSPPATIAVAGQGASPAPGLVHAADDSGIGDHGPPPAGLPVLYVAYPEKPWWLMAISWDGRVVGTVKLPEAAGRGIYAQATITGTIDASPDGSRIRVGGAVYNQAGGLVESNPDRDATARWGEDNRHLCGVRTPPAPAAGAGGTLWIADLGAAARDVATVPVDLGGNRGYDVLACSPANDRAVVSAPRRRSALSPAATPR